MEDPVLEAKVNNTSISNIYRMPQSGLDTSLNASSRPVPVSGKVTLVQSDLLSWPRSLPFARVRCCGSDRLLPLTKETERRHGDADQSRGRE